MKKDDKDKVNVAEMWFFRCLLRVRWTDKRTNESVLKEPFTKRHMLIKVERRRLKYAGHALSSTKTDLMATVLKGKIEAKRKRRRPPTSYISNITKASGLRGVQ